LVIQSPIIQNESRRVQGEYYLWHNCLKDEIVNVGQLYGTVKTFNLENYGYIV
jgi:hypothetical protein